MRILVCLLILILGLSLCRQKREIDPGGDILSKEKLIPILIDIHLAEAEILEGRYYNNDSAKRDFNLMEQKIFKKHKVDSSFYFKSYRYYAKNLNDLEEIYRQVADSLHLMDSLIKPDIATMVPQVKSDSSKNNQNGSQEKDKKAKEPYKKSLASPKINKETITEKLRKNKPEPK